MDSIKNLTRFSQDRFSDRELGRFLYQGITRDIYKTDLLLSGLLSYFQVATPIKKTNTVNALIEEVLRENKAQLEERGMRLFKKLEKNLPETIIPDEQLKYILNSVLQYALLSAPPDGNVEFLTKSFIFERETGEVQPFFERYGGYIEILAVFAGEPAAAWGRIPAPRKDEALELVLRLVKGMVLRNWGKMNLETDKKGGKTVLSLRFPLERRKVALYPSTQKMTDFATRAP